MELSREAFDKLVAENPTALYALVQALARQVATAFLPPLTARSYRKLELCQRWHKQNTTLSATLLRLRLFREYPREVVGFVHDFARRLLPLTVALDSEVASTQLRQEA